MPLMRGRKRRAEAEEDITQLSPEPSPEPATQRRRTTPEDDVYPSDTQQPNDASLEQMVKKMVRLALACEYQRKPIRRQEISEKVLGSSGTRQFKSVFNEAQTQLRTVVGMEMVELPARERITVAQKRAAQKQSQASKTATSWLLVSILPPRFRDPAILSPMSAPTSSEESKYTALYTLLISLIQLSGGSLPDAKMERYLRSLGLEDNTPLEGPEMSKTEKMFMRFDREGYIVRVKESAGVGGEEDVFWVVGPRGKVEVGEPGTSGLVRAVYGDMDEAGEEELESKLVRSLGVAEREVLAEKKQQQRQNGETRKKKGRRRRDSGDEDEDDERADEDDGEKEEEEED